MKRLALGLASITLLLCGFVGQTTPSATAFAKAPVVVILMENHEYSSIVGSGSAPYENSFASKGTLFTNYYANTHPSLPNYLALTSGQILCPGSDSCATNNYNVNNIFKQLDSANLGWRAYEESMPSNCARSSSGKYAARHNPPVYYSNIQASCAAKDVPYPSTLPSPLKAFTFVTPNLCNDMHDCSVSTGDSWLASHVPAFLAKGAIVVILFDEGSTSTNGGGHIYAAVRGPGVTAGRTNTTRFSHYNLLAGLQDYFGVSRTANTLGKTPLPI